MLVILKVSYWPPPHSFVCWWSTLYLQDRSLLCQWCHFTLSPSLRHTSTQTSILIATVMSLVYYSTWTAKTWGYCIHGAAKSWKLTFSLFSVDNIHSPWFKRHTLHKYNLFRWLICNFFAMLVPFRISASFSCCGQSRFLRARRTIPHGSSPDVQSSNPPPLVWILQSSVERGSYSSFSTWSVSTRGHTADQWLFFNIQSAVTRPSSGDCFAVSFLSLLFWLSFFATCFVGPSAFNLRPPILPSDIQPPLASFCLKVLHRSPSVIFFPRTAKHPSYFCFSNNYNISLGKGNQRTASYGSGPHNAIRSVVGL